MLRLSVPNIDDAAISAVVAVLRTGLLVQGAEGERFEAALRNYLGVPHAIAVSSGTAALHLALLAAGVGPGDAVLVPDFTFPATGNVVRLVGAIPVLVDVDPQTYCITPATASAAIEHWSGAQRLRAMMPVHEFGCPADMGALSALAKLHGLTVIEDAACAIGAQTGGRMCGSIGDVGCWSLHPRKTLTTGEGGVLATADEALAESVRRLRNHGMQRTPAGVVFQQAGYNLRLTDVQSALGLAQLPHLPQWIAQRRTLAAAYRHALEPLVARGRLALPADHPGHSWQTFMVVLNDDIDRAALIRTLAAEGIETNLGAHCLSRQPAFADIAPPPPQPSCAERLYRQGLALPFCEQYGAQQVERVVAALSRRLLVGSSV